jgi:hypothetical protein
MTSRANKLCAAGRLIPFGFLGMLPLLLAVEWGLERRSIADTPWGIWAWRHTSGAVGREAPGCDLLCFGDSLVKLGVLPAVLRERLGVRAYNFAICAGGAPASYFMLRRALDAGAKPWAVVVNYKPGMLAGRPRDFQRNWPELLTLREALELAWTAHDAEFFARYSLAALFTSVRTSHDLRTNLILAFLGRGSFLRDDTLRYAHNWDANSGAQATCPNADFRGDVDAAMQKHFMSQVFWCNPINRLYVRKFLALAQARGITVFWLLPPMSPAVQRERERTGAEAAHVRFVRKFCEEFPNLVVADGRSCGYDNSVFVDPLHLDSRGARALTTDLADLMTRFRHGPGNAPRWIEMPSYRRSTSQIALEEIEDAGVVHKRKSRGLLR